MGRYQNRTRTQKLFDQLSLDLGYCLRPDDLSRIAEKLPLSISEFAEEVLLAEGLKPEFSKNLKKGIEKIAYKWFEEGIITNDL
jgi:hypothetical protein